MFLFKILPYVLQRLMRDCHTSHLRQMLGGSHLQKSKLVFSALHLTMCAAQHSQLFAHLPLLAHLLSLDALVRQLAAALCKIVQTLVLA